MDRENPTPEPRTLVSTGSWIPGGVRTNLMCALGSIPDTLEIFLTNREFRFERVDGSVLSEHLVLAKGGKILGHTHINEHAWKIEDGNLVFLHLDGSVTTTFDRANRLGESLSFVGNFVGVGHVHRLVDRPWDATKLAPFVTGQSIGPIENKRVAVLLRSHHCDAKFQDLLARLSTNSRDYDVFALLDENSRTPQDRIPLRNLAFTCRLPGRWARAERRTLVVR